MAKKRANGEGNIRKRKDGRWEGRYTAGYDEKTGKRLIKNVLGKTQAEVKEKLARAITEAETLDTRRSDEYTLGTWLQTWYELYAKPHLRFSTAEYYRRGIELHITPRIGDIPLKKLTGRDLQWLYKDLQEHGRLREAQKGKQPGLSDSTIRGIHTMLHNALDRAVKERLIVRNPADDCVPSKIPKHEMKILPPEQIKSYLTAAEQRGVCPCSIWSSSADCAKANWWRSNGRTWTSKIRRFPSASRRDATMQANPISRGRKRKTPSAKSRFRRTLSSCWSQSTRSTPTTHGCSHHPKQARCTTRTRWSTSTRRF